MHIHVRIQHWVLWWFSVGVVVGAIALTNILLRDLSRSQERAILLIGVLNWLLGGIVCYGYDGIRIEKPGRPGQIERLGRPRNADASGMASGVRFCSARQSQEPSAAEILT
jgi:hypothetical protein